MGKKKHEEHEEHVNHEAWVIPYADMVTLLFALFLVLFATGLEADQGKLTELAGTVRTEFGIASVLPGGSGLLPANPQAIPASTLLDELAFLGGVDLNGDGQPDADPYTGDGDGDGPQRLEDLDAQLDADLVDAGLDPDAVELHRDARGITVDITADGILFASGTATLTDGGRELINLVVPLLTGIPNHVVVEGHTDDVPIATATFPSNWELSSARAGAVLRHLLAVDALPATQLSAAGYGDTRPIADNGTAQGRATNRRVEIVVVNTTQVGGAGLPNPTNPDGGTLGGPSIVPDLPAQAGLPPVD